MIGWFSLQCDEAMKRPGRVLGSLPFITGLCVAGSWLLPAMAQEPAASSPATTTAAPSAATPIAGDASGLSDKEKAHALQIIKERLPAYDTRQLVWSKQGGDCKYYNN